MFFLVLAKFEQVDVVYVVSTDPKQQDYYFALRVSDH